MSAFGGKADTALTDHAAPGDVVADAALSRRRSTPHEQTIIGILSYRNIVKRCIVRKDGARNKNQCAVSTEKIRNVREARRYARCQSLRRLRRLLLRLSRSSTRCIAGEALPLFDSGTGAMGLLSWRGKRKSAANAGRSKHLNLFEHDPNLCVCSPLRATVTACAVNKDIKVLGDADGCRYLQGCAGLRNVSDGALDLRRFVAENDKGSLQYASARGYPLFVHRLSPQHQLA